MTPKTQVNPDAIPDELKRCPQWVLWKYEEKEGRDTKVPYTTTGKRASPTNKDTWSTYEDVLMTYLSSSDYAGIGYVLTEGGGIVGIDIDDYLPEDLTELKEAGSYCEYSPSGRGLRAFVKGNIPGTRSRNGKYEIYSQGRFLTVTGNAI